MKSLIFTLLSFCPMLYAFSTSTDTTKTPLLAVVSNASATKTVVLKAANVIYPKLLENQQDEFISYVEKFSDNRRAYLLRTYAKSKSFFPKAHVILKKYNVPKEFAVLMALESAFNANAVSSAGAVGYWQIMDEVAKEYGLTFIAGQKKGVVLPKTKKPVIDDRKNFTRSTQIAGKYLQNRMRNLNNDWLLVAASYNWGVGNVWKAMERCGKTNPTFWDIKNYVPAETKAYVMNFIALNVVFANYEKFVHNDLCYKDIVKEVKITEAVAD